MNNPLFNTNVQQPSTPSYTKETFVDFDDNFDPNSGWLLLLYGMFGSGKTFFCGTALNSLYINTGYGEDTLRSPLFKVKYPNIKRKKIDIVHTAKKMGYDQVCDSFQTILDSEELQSQIKTIIVDDATALRSMAMRHGLKQARNKDISKYIDTDMSDIKNEMNRINWLLEEHLPQFKRLGINFILTAHEARIYGKSQRMGEERPLKEIRPGFSGEKFPDAVPSKFDEVFYIKLIKNERGDVSQIKTGGTGVEVTRARRAGVFPQYIVDPNFEQLLAIRKRNEIHPSYR